jgi:hypothetical protein
MKIIPPTALSLALRNTFFLDDMFRQFRADGGTT